MLSSFHFCQFCGCSFFNLRFSILVVSLFFCSSNFFIMDVGTWKLWSVSTTIFHKSPCPWPFTDSTSSLGWTFVVDDPQCWSCRRHIRWCFNSFVDVQYFSFLLMKVDHPSQTLSLEFELKSYISRSFVIFTNIWVVGNILFNHLSIDVYNSDFFIYLELH